MTAIAFPTGPIGLVLSRLQKVQKSATGWLARCPAHNDGRPSLSISEGRNGNVVLHCFAGCSYESVLSALGLEPRDLASPSSSDRRVPSSGSSTFNVDTTYDYVDANGQLRFQVVRLIPKDFRQRQPDGRGGWNYSMKGVERVLYRLPAVLEARDAGRVVFVVEGEKDADTLASLKLCATTNPGGAKKWLPGYTETLRGANVVLVPDNDKPGREHARLVATALYDVAKDIRVIAVPAPHKDVTDWVSSGATVDDIKRLVLDAAAWAPDDLASPAAPVSPTDGPPPGGTPPTASGDAPEFNLTDIGNAERLIARHGKDVRYVPRWKSWLVWDGCRYKRDETHEVERMAKATIRAWAAELEHTDASATQKAERRKHALASESDRRIAYMLARARAEIGVAVRTDDLDADPWLLTVANGTLDLRTGQLREHSRDDLCTKLVPVAYDPEAPCDLWEAFLLRIMNGNRDLIQWLQRAVGYALTGQTTEQCFFFLYGHGANGKTTFLETLRMIAGEYAAQTDFTTFLERKNEGPRNDIARLFGARAVTSSETGEGRRLNESLVKALTGTELISARFLYAELFDFMPTFKVFLAANHKPVIRGTDEGIWRRVRLIPFEVQIPPEEQDKDLLAKLRGELPGILAWAVAGCLLWQQHGLRAPDEVRDATSAYRVESDTLGAFIEDYCELGPDHGELATTLYSAYAAWCKEGGEYQISQTAFGRRLAERGIVAQKQGVGVHRKVWRVGIRLVARPMIAPRADRRNDDASSGAHDDPDPNGSLDL